MIFFYFLLTHIGKLSGNDSGDFPETFSKNFFCCIVTSLETILERGHVTSTGGGLVHLGMSPIIRKLKFNWKIKNKIVTEKTQGRTNRLNKIENYSFVFFDNKFIFDELQSAACN